MTTYQTRVMSCDHAGCTAMVMALGTLTNLRDKAAKEGWQIGRSHTLDLCPAHKQE